MATMERTREDPFTARRNTLRRTSAEIVKEARQSLRTLCTQRPYTPRDGERQLFGGNTFRANRESRPPSTFSIHARHFDAPDSRPGSGNRLAPLDHRPKLPVPEIGEELPKVHPRPPTEPPTESKKGLQVARARLLRAGSMTTLPPLEQSSNAEERLSSEQRRHSPKEEDGRPPGARRHIDLQRGPPKPAPHKAANERIRQPDVDSPAGAKQRVTGERTGLSRYSEINPHERRRRERSACRQEDAESLVWDEKIVPLLDKLDTGRAEGSVDLLCDLCTSLNGVLAQHDLLGRRCRKRAGILRALFRLIDLDSAHLNLHIATLCLALCVSGNNLLNICKLIFKISRSECHDILFENSSILDSLLVVLNSEDVCVSGEALLYCVGTLKFLSGNDALLKLLLAKGFVGAAQHLLQQLHPLSESGHAHFAIAGHILVQLTAALRSLADLPDSRPLFLSHGLLSELCIALRHHQEDKDVCTNIARIYSKLSLYSECRLALAKIPDCYQLFIELLNKHQQKQDIVVRLLFTLGNLTAKSDEVRETLFRCGGRTGDLLRLYRAYQPRDDSTGDSPPGSGREREDVLVKLVRVLANMCVHAAVGPAMAADPACIQLLMETLERRSLVESELLVNVAATINNLSFYQEDNSAVKDNQLEISKLLLKLMLSSSMDAVLEATRVYGNLTKWKEVRDFIMQNKVYQFVVTLLDSKSCEMCFAACGVLTNLTFDPPSRHTLTLEGAATKLVDCLRDFGQKDWQLAGQVCQTLWNLTEQGGSERVATLGQQEREALFEVLTAYSCEEEAFQWIVNDDMREYHKACWELEFLPVAQKLINRLQPVNYSDLDRHL